MSVAAFPGRVVALLLLLAFPACYSYVSVEDGMVKRGDEVRLSTRPDAAASEPGEEDGRIDLQGVVVTRSQDSLVLWRRPLLRGATRVEEVSRDTVAVALSGIGSIERSELDGVKTVGLVVGSLGVIAGFAVLASNAEGGGTGDFGGGDGGNLLIRLPVP